jgi:MFS transporter, DHA2 family, multidrug resistance protein
MTTISSRWWTLGALVLSTLAVGLDTTILSVALPTLATDLNASTAQLQWFVDSYNLVLAALLLPAGLLGDRYGRKRLLTGALVAFGAASVWCAYAGSPGGLIAARSVLAVGAAFLLTLPGAVLPVIFPPEERPRAVGAWVTASVLSFPLGPIVGGLLLKNFWWGSVFLINVPVVVLAVVAVSLLMPESRSAHRPRLDPVGLGLAVAALVVVTWAVIEAGEQGWADGRVWGGLIAGAVLGWSFVTWQRRLQAQPSDRPLLIDLSIFREKGFTWGIVVAVLATFAMFGLLFTAPLYFQTVKGHDALGSGLRLLPVVAGMIVGSRSGERLVARFSVKAAVGLGFALMAGGLALGATTSATSGFALVAGWMAVFGVGLGITLPVAMSAAIGAIEPERSGMASGLLMALRMVGGSIGVAVLGAVVNGVYRGGLPDRLPPEAEAAVRDGVSTGAAVAVRLGSPRLLHDVGAAFVHGMDVMLATGAVIALAGLAVGVVFLPNRVAAARPGQRESEHDVVG